MLQSCSLNAIYPVPVLKVQTFKYGIHSESLALFVYAAFPATAPDPTEKPGHFRERQRLFSECSYLRQSFNLFPLIWVKAITFYDLRYKCLSRFRFLHVHRIISPLYVFLQYIFKQFERIHHSSQD